MNVRIPNGGNSQKCPRCGTLMRQKGWGYRCHKCSYEQLNNEGREFIERMNMKETVG